MPGPLSADDDAHMLRVVALGMQSDLRTGMRMSGDGLDRVDDQIAHHELDLQLVDEQVGQARLARGAKGDVQAVPGGGADEPRGREQRVDGNPLQARGSFAEEVSQAAYDLGCALRFGQHFLDHHR